MGYSLGIDVGTTYTATAICRTDDTGAKAPEVIGLGTRSRVAASVVFIGDDGNWLVGDAAERRAHDRPELVVREFKRRVGDPVPFVVGDARPLAETLVAGVVRWALGRVTELEGAAPSAITLTHPASWGAYKLGLVRAALDHAQLGNVTFVSEPVAAAMYYATQSRVPVGAAVAVYDLGGGTFDTAVVRKIDDQSFELLGVPGGLDQVGGADFDEAVLRYVQRTAQLPPIDLDDRDKVAAMLRLHRECIEAKEALSVDTETTIPVLVPDCSTRVRLVRSAFEELIQDRIVETVDTLAATIASAGLSAEELDSVLLVGGSSRIPLVCRLVSERLARPIVVDADPQTAIALGAAVTAVTGSRRTRTVPLVGVAAPPRTGSRPNGDGQPTPSLEPPERPRAVPIMPSESRPQRGRGVGAFAGAAAGVVILTSGAAAFVESSDAPAVVADESTMGPPEWPSPAIAVESLDTVGADDPADGASLAAMAFVIGPQTSTGVSTTTSPTPHRAVRTATAAGSATSPNPFGAPANAGLGTTTTPGTAGPTVVTTGSPASSVVSVPATGTTPSTTRPSTSSPPATNTSGAGTQVAGPPSTDPSPTVPPTTQPPASDPPATDPPTTDPPTTDPSPSGTTTPPTDPAPDNVTIATEAPTSTVLMESPPSAGGDSPDEPS